MTADRVPRVAVVVTAWNTAPYIDACLDSICSSSLSDIEICLVDDGSTDGTTDRCEAWASRDDRIQFMPSPRVGRNGALRLAHSLVTADVACWVDSDDLVAETGIQRCLDALDDEHEVATTLRMRIDVDGRPLGQDPWCNGAEPRTTHFWHHLRLFTVDLFDRAGGVGDLDGSIDFDMNLRFAEHTKAVFLREILYSMRERPGRMNGGVAQTRGHRQALENARLRAQSIRG